MAGLGNIAAQILIDDQQARRALENVDRLSKITELSLRQLSQSAQKSLIIDSKGTTVPLAEIGRGFDEVSKKQKEGGQTVQQFRTEQRTQAFVIREGSQALLGMVSALSLLQTGSGGADGSVKRFTTGLTSAVVAMNATEFAFFGLGQAGERMGGKVGGALATFSKFGGIAGAIVGLTAGVVAFFNSTNEASQKAADEGLKSFNDELSKIGLTADQKKNVQKNLEADVKAINDIIAKIEPISVTEESGSGDVFGQAQTRRIFSEQDRERIANLEKLRDGKQKQLKSLTDELLVEDQKEKNRREAQEAAIKDLNEVQRLKIQIGELDKKKTEGTATREELNLLAQLQSKLKDLQSTRDEMIAKEITELESRFNLHKMSAIELEDELKQYQSLAQSAELQRSISEKLLSVRKEIAENEKKIAAVQNDLGDTRPQGNSGRGERVTREHELEAEAIDEIAKARVTIIDDESERKIRAIEIERDAELAKMNELLQKELISQDEVDVYTKAKNAEIAGLKEQQQQKIADKQIQDLDDLISDVDKLGNALHNALGGAGDTFIQKMLAALQISLQLVKQFEKISKQKEGAGFGDVLGIFTSILGFGGLFDKGGYTGDSPAHQPAGIVHGGEVVFEKPIVSRYKNELLALRESLKGGRSLQGFAEGGFVGNTVTNLFNSDALIHEIRQLRSDVRELEIQQPINLRAELDSMRFFKEEEPKYRKFEAKKKR